MRRRVLASAVFREPAMDRFAIPAFEGGRHLPFVEYHWHEFQNGYTLDRMNRAVQNLASRLAP
jgi:hypothetical protein